MKLIRTTREKFEKTPHRELGQKLSYELWGKLNSQLDTPMFFMLGTRLWIPLSNQLKNQLEG